MQEIYVQTPHIRSAYCSTSKKNPIGIQTFGCAIWMMHNVWSQTWIYRVFVPSTIHQWCHSSASWYTLALFFVVACSPSGYLPQSAQSRPLSWVVPVSSYPGDLSNYDGGPDVEGVHLGEGFIAKENKPMVPTCKILMDFGFILFGCLSEAAIKLYITICMLTLKLKQASQLYIYIYISNHVISCNHAINCGDGLAVVLEKLSQPVFSIILTIIGTSHTKVDTVKAPRLAK